MFNTQTLLKLLEKTSKVAPLLILLLWIEGFSKLFLYFGIMNIIRLSIILYIIPPLLYRLYALAIPLKNGVSYLKKDAPANGWIVAHRFQILYHIFESLERILRIIPGAYNAWLRLWGSKVGKNVYWTPHTRVGDRTHLNIGDNVFIGNSTYISPHIVRKKTEGFSLIMEEITIESNVFIGTHCTLGPGAHLKEGEELPAFTTLMGRKARQMSAQEIEL
jgi:hypothetical protein